MTHPTDDSAKDDRALRFASLAAREVEDVLRLLPIAQEVQWDRSTAGMGERDETGRRAIGGHSDPTADTAADPARLYLREVLGRCEPHLEQALVLLRGVRRGLERAMERWEGVQDEEVESASPEDSATPAA